MSLEKKDNKFVLVLDHDGIVHANELIEEYIRDIDYRGSAAHREYLYRLAEERALTAEQFDRLFKEHITVKDQILEEVYEHFENRIPYGKIYTLENAYRDIVNTIRFIRDCDVFDEIIVNSHVNGILESSCKEKFYKKYLPFVKTYFPYFHLEAYDITAKDLTVNNDRLRTNKAIYLMKQRSIEDLSGYYAVDDSSSICHEYEDAGAKAFYKLINESSKDTLYRAARSAFDDRRKMEEKGRAYVKK